MPSVWNVSPYDLTDGAGLTILTGAAATPATTTAWLRSAVLAGLLVLTDGSHFSGFGNPAPPQRSPQVSGLTPTTRDRQTVSAGSSLPVDGTLGARTVRLPPAALSSVCEVVKTDASANTVTVVPHGTDTILPASSAAVLSAQGGAVRLFGTGVGTWIAVSVASVGANTATALTRVANASAASAAAGVLGQPMALTGATTPTRYVGGTASGSPLTGTFAKGDFVVAQNAVVWTCTTAGTPGSWTPSYSAALGQSLSLTGATLPSRFLGATTAGAPSTGTFAVGDVVPGQNGTLSVCTVAGTPGTWVTVGGPASPVCEARLTANFSPAAVTDIYAQGGWAAYGPDPYSMVNVPPGSGTYSYIQIPTAWPGRYYLRYHATSDIGLNGSHAIKIARNAATTANSVATDLFIRSSTTGGDGAVVDAITDYVFAGGDKIYWCNWLSAAGWNVLVSVAGINVPTAIEVRYVGPN